MSYYIHTEVSPFASALLTLATKRDVALLSRAGPACWMFARSYEFASSKACGVDTKLEKRDKASGLVVQYTFTGTGAFELFCNEYMSAREKIDVDFRALEFARLLHTAMADKGSATLFLFACACRANLRHVASSMINLAISERKKRSAGADDEGRKNPGFLESKLPYVVDWFDDLGAHADTVAFGWALAADATKTAQNRFEKKQVPESAFIGLEARGALDWTTMTLAEAFLWIAAEHDSVETLLVLLGAGAFKRNVSAFMIDVAKRRLAQTIVGQAHSIRFDGKTGGPRLNVAGQKAAYELARFELEPIEESFKVALEARRLIEQFDNLVKRVPNAPTELVDQFVLPAGSPYEFVDEYGVVSSGEEALVAPTALAKKARMASDSGDDPNSVTIGGTRDPIPRSITPIAVEQMRISQGFAADDDDADIDDKQPEESEISVRVEAKQPFNFPPYDPDNPPVPVHVPSTVHTMDFSLRPQPYQPPVRPEEVEAHQAHVAAQLDAHVAPSGGGDTAMLPPPPRPPRNDTDFDHIDLNEFMH